VEVKVVPDADLAAGSGVGQDGLIYRVRLQNLGRGLGGSTKVDVDRGSGSGRFTGSTPASDREVPLSEADCMS
jgi:hypothetical protein